MNRLNDHLSKYNLLPANQSAYRAHHSTETAVLAFVNDITRSIDDGHLCALVLLDLSAAFDTIDHDIMLETLESRFSLTEGARSWFQSYLTQVYCVGLEVSPPIPLKYGVPQGSMAWPVNFICYTEDVEVVISDFQVRHHLYANDMQLLAKTLPQHLDSCRQELEDCTAAIHDWCRARKLQLIPDKTELIWFGSKHLLQKIPPEKSSILVCSVQVSPVSFVRNLGVLLDSQLDIKSHINSIVSAGFYYLRRLRQVRQILSRDLRQRLVSALILSKIDYCNAVLVGLPASSLQPLKRLIRAAARYVADLGPFDSVSGTLKELHWLPIEQRIEYKLCLRMHSVVGNVAASYLNDMVTRVADPPDRTCLFEISRIWSF